MKQIKNVLKAEGQFEKDQGSLNFKNLSKKLTVKPSDSQSKEKQELHLLRKEHFGGLRGPGAYPITAKHTSFNKPPRPEQL